MAEKKPLVLNENGSLEVLQSGDTIPHSVLSGGMTILEFDDSWNWATQFPFSGYSLGSDISISSLIGYTTEKQQQVLQALQDGKTIHLNFSYQFSIAPTSNPQYMGVVLALGQFSGVPFLRWGASQYFSPTQVDGWISGYFDCEITYESNTSKLRRQVSSVQGSYSSTASDTGGTYSTAWGAVNPSASTDLQMLVNGQVNTAQSYLYLHTALIEIL
jgi:hypothetical protein